MAATSSSPSGRVVTRRPVGGSRRGSSGTDAGGEVRTIWWPWPPKTCSQPAGGWIGVPRKTHDDAGGRGERGQVPPRRRAVVGRGVEHGDVGAIAAGQARRHRRRRRAGRAGRATRRCRARRRPVPASDHLGDPRSSAAAAFGRHIARHSGHVVAVDDRGDRRGARRVQARTAAVRVHDRPRSSTAGPAAPPRSPTSTAGRAPLTPTTQAILARLFPERRRRRDPGPHRVPAAPQPVQRARSDHRHDVR